jgi:hypothetical protein
MMNTKYAENFILSAMAPELRELQDLPGTQSCVGPRNTR